MANTGVRTIKNLGCFDVSGAALIAAVTDAQQGATASGAGLVFVPVSNGQKIQLFDVELAIS